MYTILKPILEYVPILSSKYIIFYCNKIHNVNDTYLI